MGRKICILLLSIFLYFAIVYDCSATSTDSNLVEHSYYNVIN